MFKRWSTTTTKALGVVQPTSVPWGVVVATPNAPWEVVTATFDPHQGWLLHLLLAPGLVTYGLFRGKTIRVILFPMNSHSSQKSFLQGMAIPQNEK